MAVTVSTVEMKDGSNRCKVVSPYNPAFVLGARELNGKFSSSTKAWYFDTRDDTRVRELCRRVYGTDGSATGPSVTVHLHLDGIRTDADELYAVGRRVASRLARDSTVRLGTGVVLLAGGFAASGGSVRYPEIGALPGTVLEVRDVPADIAQREAAENHGVKVIDANVERLALETQKATLMAQLAEIEARLSALK